MTLTNLLVRGFFFDRNSFFSELTNCHRNLVLFSFYMKNIYSVFSSIYVQKDLQIIAFCFYLRFTQRPNLIRIGVCTS